MMQTVRNSYSLKLKYICKGQIWLNLGEELRFVKCQLEHLSILVKLNILFNYIYKFLGTLCWSRCHKEWLSLLMSWSGSALKKPALKHINFHHKDWNDAINTSIHLLFGSTSAPRCNTVLLLCMRGLRSVRQRSLFIQWQRTHSTVILPSFKRSTEAQTSKISFFF